jgi:opacity protein-like surface antigen
MSRVASLCASIALLLGSASVGFAQDAAPRPKSFEVSASGLMIGGVDFGNQNATLTGNDPGNPDFVLFATSSKIKAGAGLDARMTFNVTRTFAIEGAFAWTRQTAETDITSDVEGVPHTTLKEDLSTYFIEAAAVVHLRGLQFAHGRGIPFVFGGGGYLRQLDEDSILVDTGTVFHAGGGIKYFIAQRPRGFVRDVGIRVDGRIYLRSGGLELVEEKERRSTWGLAAGLVVRF